MEITELNPKYLTHHWHYTNGIAWASILSSGYLKSRRLLIAETLQAREDWPELKRNHEALTKALPPYLKGRHSPLRRKGMLFLGQAPLLRDTGWGDGSRKDAGSPVVTSRGREGRTFSARNEKPLLKNATDS